MKNCLDLEIAIDERRLRQGDSERAEDREQHRGVAPGRSATAIEVEAPSHEEPTPVEVSVEDADGAETGNTEKPDTDTSVPLTRNEMINASDATPSQLRKGLDKLKSPASADARDIIRKWIVYREAQEQASSVSPNPARFHDRHERDGAQDLTDQGVAWRR